MRRIVMWTLAGLILVAAASALLRTGSDEPSPAARSAERAAINAPIEVPHPPMPAESPAATPETPAAAAETTLAAWLALANQPSLTDLERSQLAEAEARLQQEGEAAADLVLAHLARTQTPGLRERLFNLLRTLPGSKVEAALAHEATRGDQPSTRAMAMEALASRRTPAALEALAEVAEHDPELPPQPLITQGRSPDDPSTELPDEQVYTPRMQAMAALASTKEPRALSVLASVVRTGPDEALRMEAARLLGDFRDEPAAREVLGTAAASDPSAYVRLAALHSLSGAHDPLLATVLARVASHDRDAGVRILAQRVLNEIPSP